MSNKDRFLLPGLSVLTIVIVTAAMIYWPERSRLAGSIGMGLIFNLMAWQVLRVEKYYIDHIDAMIDTLERSTEEILRKSEERYPFEELEALRSKLEMLIPKRTRGRPAGIIYPPGFEKKGIKIIDALPGLAELQKAKDRGELPKACDANPNPWGGGPIAYRTAYGWLETYRENIAEYLRNSRE